MPFKRIYLDANILIGLGEGESTVKDLFLRIAVQAVANSNMLFVTSNLTFSEILVKPFRMYDEALAATYKAWSVGSEWLNVCRIDDEILELAALIRADRKTVKLPDAIHMATALLSECSHFLSTDPPIRNIEWIDHPFNGRQSFSALTVIRPDEPTLTSILTSLAND